jgi:hypothetical protein
MLNKKNNDCFWNLNNSLKLIDSKKFFKRDAQFIAEGLKAVSMSHAQALDKINFYIIISGKNLDKNSSIKLENAKKILDFLYTFN